MRLMPGARAEHAVMVSTLYILRRINMETLLSTPGLRRYVAIPLAINVALFGGGLWWAWSQIEPLTSALESWLPDWLDFLSVLLVPLFIIAALGFNYYDVGRQTGRIVLRVLKGEAPGEIAVQGVEITELHVNPGAAKKMGVTIPSDVIAEAKTVIE